MSGLLLMAGASWGQTNNAQFVSQSLPTQLTVNQTASVSVVFKNTGTTTWTAAAGDNLGSQNPQDNTTWGASRVPLNGGEAIAPGQQKSFQFTIKAPATAGVYNFQTKMVREGVAWYGSASPNLAITVSAPKVYYVHVDHLNTPRMVTDEQKVVVWRNTPVGEPFGVSAAEEDPDGNGQKFVMNLRFPGQYFDKETNLNYNYYRDYNPQIGRYIQSDPIGLTGGINTYGYVGGNPISRKDARGLSPEDVGKIRAAFNQVVDQMTKDGERITVYSFNNAFADQRNDENPFWPKEVAGTLSCIFRDCKTTLICGQQWEKVKKVLEKLEPSLDV